MGRIMKAGSEFQAIGPATEKARQPNIERQWCDINSWWQLADAAERVGDWDASCTVELWTADTGLQLCNVCTTLTYYIDGWILE